MDRILPSIVMRYADQVAERLSQFDEKILTFTSAMYLCYPLALIQDAVPYGKWKHFTSFILGVLLLQFTIGWEWLYILFVALVAYAMILILPTRKAKNVVPIFLLSVLSVGHIEKMVLHYLQWHMCYTLPLMILTIKLYALTFNLYDGELLQQEHSGKLKERTNVGRATQRCARFAVFQTPSLLEYLGYTFCFSTILAGPAFEYRVYADACNGTLVRVNARKKHDQKKGNAQQLPSRVWPTLGPFFMSVVCMILHIIGTKKFPLFDPANLEKNPPVILTEEFLTHPFHHRILYCYISLFFLRMRYYFPWKSAEGSTNYWYGGFEGFDENGNALGFKHSTNVDILKFELSPSFKTITNSLNKKTASWLSRYVYSRTDGSLVATYALSAFWHGFYPGYYLYFLSSPLVMICDRLANKKILPHMNRGWKGFVWRCVSFVWLRLIMVYIVVPFFILSWGWSIAWWKSCHFYGHICCAFFAFFAMLLPSTRGSKDAKKED